MSDITSINGVGTTGGIPFTRSARAEAPATYTPTPDRVEISDVARLLSTLDTDGQQPMRAQKIAEIREAIANGTYESEDKIDYVVDRLMSEMGTSAEFVEN